MVQDTQDASMDDSHRTILFLLVCLPIRFLIAVAAAVSCDGPEWVRYVVAAYCIWTALGFLWQLLVLRPTHGAFGGKVWWGGVRWIHATSFATAAVLLVTRCEYGVIPLVFDPLLGLVTFVVTHS